jgi:hypothetical protein
MIWLIGCKGMLATAVLELLKKQEKLYMISDQEIDITNIDRLNEIAANKSISWIINCAAYTAVDKADAGKSQQPKYCQFGGQQWKYNLSLMQKVRKRRQLFLSMNGNGQRQRKRFLSMYICMES